MYYKYRYIKNTPRSQGRRGVRTHRNRGQDSGTVGLSSATVGDAGKAIGNSSRFVHLGAGRPRGIIIIVVGSIIMIMISHRVRKTIRVGIVLNIERRASSI